MKDISIIVSLDQTLKDLKLTLGNLNNGNFEKWGLTPVLPTRKDDKETLEEAAKRFWQESGWVDKVQTVIPGIKKWWSEIGGKIAESLAQDLNVDEPDKYNIVLVPFGPGGSYNANISAVYIRITDFDNDKWWKRVLIHEIAHLLSVHLDFSNHQENEERVNKLMRSKLIEFGLEDLI